MMMKAPSHTRFRVSTAHSVICEACQQAQAKRVALIYRLQGHTSGHDKSVSRCMWHTCIGVRHQRLAAQEVLQLLLDDSGRGGALAAGKAQTQRQATASEDGNVCLRNKVPRLNHSMYRAGAAAMAICIYISRETAASHTSAISEQ